MVTEKPYPPQRQSSHIVTATQLATFESPLYRLIAACLLVFSVVGTILGFSGGVEALLRWDDRSWFAVILGIVWQIAVSGSQLITCRDWRNPVYLIALAASAIPSLIGYQPLIAAPIAGWLANLPPQTFENIVTVFRAGPQAVLFGGVVHSGMIVVLVAFDVIPERILVKHQGG